MESSREDLKKRTYRFSLEIVKFMDHLPKDKASDIIGHQLLRSGTSVGTNVTEAKAASSKRDFVNFYNHALKSANETIFWLELLRDSEKGDKEKLNILIKEASELANILGAIILKLRQNMKQ